MVVNGWQLTFSERFEYSRFNNIVLPLKLSNDKANQIMLTLRRSTEGGEMAKRILIAGALIFHAGMAFGQSRQEQRATLRGLKGIVVAIEDLEPEIEREGLTSAQIRTDAELKIHKANIQILPLNEEIGRASCRERV